MSLQPLDPAEMLQHLCCWMMTTGRAIGLQPDIARRANAERIPKRLRVPCCFCGASSLDPKVHQHHTEPGHPCTRQGVGPQPRGATALSLECFDGERLALLEPRLQDYAAAGGELRPGQAKRVKGVRLVVVLLLFETAEDLNIPQSHRKHRYGRDEA